MIRFEKVSFSYNADDTIISNVDLTINNNETVLLCGSSGIGKSTCLKIGAGLLKPTNGRIIIDDTDIYNLSEKKRTKFRFDNIGFLSQETCLIDSISVKDNIILPLIINTNEKVDSLLKKAMFYLKYVNLYEYADRFPKELSGGQKRRVEIARTLINEPKFIFMDEPSNSLDDKCVEELLNLLLKMKNDERTMLISTHDDRLKQQESRIIYIKNKKFEE